MFEKSLKDRIKRIFDLDKVSFDKSSDSQEQEGAFIEIETAKCVIRDKREIAKVQGKIVVFGNSDKIPYGYFTKCIAEADPDDTTGLFFFNFEENRGTFRNIAERSLGFLYLFDGQYDPSVGTITEINLSTVES